MAELYTVTGERPDLRALASTVNPPTGYIGTRILPVLKVRQKTGTIYYHTVVSDVAAQTGRSTGAAPTGTQIAPSSTTFTTAEMVSRGMIAPDEVDTYGDIAKADEIGGSFAIRNVMKLKETNVCAATLGIAATLTFDPAKIQTQVQGAKATVKRYPGRRVLFGAEETWARVVQAVLAETKTNLAFSRLVTGTDSAKAAEGLSMEALLRGFAIYCGVSEILVGDDDVWGAGSYDGKFGLTVLPEGADEFSFKYRPELGRQVQYLPGDGMEFYMESIGDRNEKNNKYDATCWNVTKVLNSGACVTWSGVAA